MKRLSVIAACVAAGAALTAAGFYAGRSNGHPGATSPAAPAMSSSNAKERKVLYWHDPMVPGPRFERPGKSPFMDMQLVPVYADEGADAGVKVSPTIQQNLGIRLAPVRRVELSASFDAVGSVQFDERLSVAVQTRVPGYVERLSVRAPMERVRKGQALATVYAPEWLGPLNELSALKRAGASEELIVAARERTQALSIPTELVRQAEDGGAPNARFVLAAPAAGVIAELGVREGMAVSPGTSLFRIAGLERVWAVAEIPEAQAVRLAPGLFVQARLQADPTQAFAGKLTELLPEISANTRTLKARFEIDNRNGKLIPGMLLRLEVSGPASMRLVVPAEAVIRTGRRAVVLVSNERGSFESRDVTVGPEIGEDIEVTQGLAEGDQVVASGQFLIDSEARLRSVTGSLAAPVREPASAASMPTSRPSGVPRAGATQ
ncbi:MAG: efflux RND transporter periplasmic adaptor subunit [Pseudomonadota bacterium]|nr:efflux RND transporter periplasmic adaptor subunit [Pseudomonadota bacterium]